MIKEIFSMPIFYGKINLNKIKLENKKFQKKWLSETKTSFGQNNYLEKNSEIYLKNIFNDELKKIYKNKFNLQIKDIWENIYEKDDFQDPHIHTQSHFSFVVYKDVENSNTVFFNPLRYLIWSFRMSDIFTDEYKPKLKKGDYIMFPSFLEHMVLKNSKSKTISGNLWISYV